MEIIVVKWAVNKAKCFYLTAKMIKGWKLLLNILFVRREWPLIELSQLKASKAICC